MYVYVYMYACICIYVYMYMYLIMYNTHNMYNMYLFKVRGLVRAMFLWQAHLSNTWISRTWLKKAQPLDSAFLNLAGENGPIPPVKFKKAQRLNRKKRFLSREIGRKASGHIRSTLFEHTLR